MSAHRGIKGVNTVTLPYDGSSNRWIVLVILRRGRHVCNILVAIMMMSNSKYINVYRSMLVVLVGALSFRYRMNCKFMRAWHFSSDNDYVNSSSVPVQSFRSVLSRSCSLFVENRECQHVLRSSTASIVHSKCSSLVWSATSSVLLAFRWPLRARSLPLKTPNELNLVSKTCRRFNSLKISELGRLVPYTRSPGG